MGRKKHLEQLKEFKLALAKEVPIDKMILFGSRAKGKSHRWSDFDVLVISKWFENKKFRYRGIGFRKLWQLDYPVDFLCYTPKEFHKLKKEPSLVSQAVREGITI
ncbi:nucleotidyltransferase domain-containing protein [Candidatus Woesearchaeota archaeon]|nr:nucleotidyltransferase domain-containing protein [Candidatus Woesearchaeota archaeon]